MISINKKLIQFISAGFIVSAIFLSILYLNGKNGSEKEVESTSVKANIPTEITKTRDVSSINQQPVVNNREQVSLSAPTIPIVNDVITKNNTISPPHPSQENDDIVAGLDMTYDELKALHERQMEEMSNGPSSSLMGIEVAGNPEITFEELKALHEKQRMEIASENNWDEIVVASSGYGETGSGLTRAEVTRLHEKQNDEWVNTDEWEEIDPLETEQDSPLLTTGDILMLQDEQNINILRDMENPYQSPAPSLDEGGIDMTVREIKEMHSKQAQE